MEDACTEEMNVLMNKGESASEYKNYLECSQSVLLNDGWRRRRVWSKEDESFSDEIIIFLERKQCKAHFLLSQNIEEFECRVL